MNFQHCNASSASAGPNGLNKPITLLYNNWLVLADNPLLIYRSFHDNTFATAETQNITLKCFKRCPASFALKCPKRGYALVADDPITNISASQPHERCKLRPISNQVTNNFQQSFPNLRKSSKFLRSDSDGGEPAKEFVIAGVFRTPKRISKSSIHPADLPGSIPDGKIFNPSSRPSWEHSG